MVYKIVDSKSMSNRTNRTNNLLIEYLDKLVSVNGIPFANNTGTNEKNRRGKERELGRRRREGVDGKLTWGYQPAWG